MEAAHSNTNRLKQIADIDDFVNSIEEDLTKIISDLEWTKAELMKDNRSQGSSSLKTKSNEGNDALTDYYLLPSETKLDLYQKSLENEKKKPEIEMTDFSLQSTSSGVENSSKARAIFTDINKLKRDLKRRRMKYKTTKTPPLTYTEELKELIGLQMEMFEKKN